MQNLVIVESPTKARTLSKFLGKDYQIEASMGHIRDLPKANLGIDIANNFEPQYIIPRDKLKKVNELKKIAKEAENLWLATDPDREGEAIAWHLATLLREARVQNPESRKGKKQAKAPPQLSILDSHSIRRVVFHEITEEAIKDAFNHPRQIDLQLVDAQQARRVLDRLVGYKLSPVLWQKVKRGLSAGRVQSVALRLIVEREKEINAFTAIEYWSIEAILEATTDSSAKRKFSATLISLNDKKLEIHTKDEADSHLQVLQEASYQINKITQKQVRRQSSPPFTTSTLQQTAGNKLGFSAKKTMMLAQNLYEQGFITYMRTDSFNLSLHALTAARQYISSHFDSNYLPEKPRVFKSKVKNAQEAHEAIRPTNINVMPADVEGVKINRDHHRLYELIWKRMLASQMADAQLEQTSVDVLATPSALSHEPLAMSDNQNSQKTHSSQLTAHDYLLRASGSVIKFPGWLTLYNVPTPSEKDQNEEESDKEKEVILPQLFEKEPLNLLQLLPDQHFTEPPPRFTESTLVKKLEELGIGRPSTYAPIISTIQERLYVERLERKFLPTVLGIAVNDFLMSHFPDIFDYTFTAEMEENLDEISRGERNWKETLAKFYSPLEKKIEATSQNAERVNLPVETTDQKCPTCGKFLIVRHGRFGKFLACSGFPECKYTQALQELVNAKCPDDGGDVVIRRTKRGKIFYGCKNYPNCKYATWTKPKAEN